MKILLLNDTSDDFHYGSYCVMNNLKLIIKKFNATIIKSIKAGKAINKEDYLDKKFDIVIVNGEGTIHHNNKKAINLISQVKEISEKTNIPIFLINATLFKNNNIIYKNFHIFQRIFVRDLASKKELDRFNIKSTVCADLTFYSGFKKKKNLKAKKKIAITDSVKRDISENLFMIHLNMKNSTYLPLIYKEKNSILSKIKTKIYSYLFLTFKISFNEKHLKRIYFKKNLGALISSIQDSTFLLTGRYHAVCFAIQTETPFLALESNTKKIQFLIEYVGLSCKRSVKKNSLGSNTLLKLDYSSHEIKLIRNFNKLAKKNILNMFNVILNSKKN